MHDPEFAAGLARLEVSPEAGWGEMGMAARLEESASKRKRRRNSTLLLNTVFDTSREAIDKSTSSDYIPKRNPVVLFLLPKAEFAGRVTLAHVKLGLTRSVHG